MGETNSSPVRPTRSRPAGGSLFGARPLRPLIVILVIAGIIFGGFVAIDFLLNPWAHKYPGHPALVGYWHGRVTYAPGDDRELALQLGHFTGRNAPNRDFTGAAKVCGHKGKASYTVGGVVKRSDGSALTLSLAQGRGTPGLHLTDIEGSWDGNDLVALHGRLYTIDKDGVAQDEVSADAGGSSGASGTIRFELRRSTDNAFAASC